MGNETIARRYGTALADVVLEKGETDTVKAELRVWEEMLNTNLDLQNAFSNPTIGHSAKEQLLEGLLEKTKPTKTTSNFLRILVKNGRLNNLHDINEKFASVLEERSGTVIARITSARNLPDSERSDFQKKLEKLTGKKVNLDFEIDKEIIGGVVTRIGSTVYDGSVRTKLENLREQLISG
jgi:F-type H+-transporting ATPase subunit delta